MSEEEIKQEPTEEKNPVVEQSNDVTQDEIDAIQAEIDKANEKMVSEDIQKRIAEERDAAKKEAEKEFLTNLRIKELEKEKEELKKQQEQREREAAQQLELLKQKVNELAAARAVVKEDNPFKSREIVPPKEDTLTDEMADEIERASYDAFMEMRNRSE